MSTESSTHTQDSANDRQKATTVSRSITIGRAPEVIYRRWQDPQTLPQLLKEIADVTHIAHNRWSWSLPLPMGQTLTWQTEVVEEDANCMSRWRATEGAAIPIEGMIELSPAPSDWGTEVKITFHFDPPGGKLGDSAAKLLGNAPAVALGKVLRRFKSLVETGEIPTTHYQPAGRKEGRDE